MFKSSPIHCSMLGMYFKDSWLLPKIFQLLMPQLAPSQKTWGPTFFKKVLSSVSTQMWLWKYLYRIKFLCIFNFSILMLNFSQLPHLLFNFLFITYFCLWICCIACVLGTDFFILGFYHSYAYETLYNFIWVH